MGERELIRRISEILGGVENDDCAVIDAGERYLVATTDMLHRKTDFPDIMNPWQMGWMAVAVNLSDIAAMGAEPAGVLIAAGLPPEADLYFIDELFSGFGDCAAYYGTRILGGDTDCASGADHHRHGPGLCGEGSGVATQGRPARRPALHHGRAWGRGRGPVGLAAGRAGRVRSSRSCWSQSRGWQRAGPWPKAALLRQ